MAVPGFPFLARLAINPQFPLEICSFGEERGNTTKSNLYCVVYTSCHFYIVRCFDPPSLVLSILIYLKCDIVKLIVSAEESISILMFGQIRPVARFRSRYYIQIPIMMLDGVTRCPVPSTPPPLQKTNIIISCCITQGSHRPI